jgi:preprotein translocase subunit SecY
MVQYIDMVAPLKKKIVKIICYTSFSLYFCLTFSKIQNWKISDYAKNLQDTQLQITLQRLSKTNKQMTATTKTEHGTETKIRLVTNGIE